MAQERSLVLAAEAVARHVAAGVWAWVPSSLGYPGLIRLGANDNDGWSETLSPQLDLYARAHRACEVEEARQRVELAAQQRLIKVDFVQQRRLRT